MTCDSRSTASSAQSQGRRLPSSARKRQRLRRSLLRPEFHDLDSVSVRTFVVARAAFPEQQQCRPVRHVPAPRQPGCAHGRDTLLEGHMTVAPHAQGRHSSVATILRSFQRSQLTSSLISSLRGSAQSSGRPRLPNWASGPRCRVPDARREPGRALATLHGVLPGTPFAGLGDMPTRTRATTPTPMVVIEDGGSINPMNERMPPRPAGFHEPRPTTADGRAQDFAQTATLQSRASKAHSAWVRRFISFHGKRTR